MKREKLTEELGRVVSRLLNTEMKDGDELYITYSVDVVRDGTAVTGEGGDRMYELSELDKSIFGGGI